MNLSHLQNNLPWDIPYTPEFENSNEREGHRATVHDILHVMKSLGKIAAMMERLDHEKPLMPGAHAWDLADNLCDLVICALHIANTNPFGEIDLEQAVINKLQTRNKCVIPKEVNGKDELLSHFKMSLHNFIVDTWGCTPEEAIKSSNSHQDPNVQINIYKLMEVCGGDWFKVVDKYKQDSSVKTAGPRY